MKIETFYTFNREEIERHLHPRAVCELSHGSSFYKIKEKMVFKENFNVKEQEIVEKIKRISYKWNIDTGTPDNYKISSSDYLTWRKFYKFLCAYCTAYGKGDEDFMK